MTTWKQVAEKVRDSLQSAIPYCKITIIGSFTEYIQGATNQAVIDSIDGVVILLAPPSGDVYNPSHQPMLSGFFRKKFEVEIAVVVKNDPQMMGRLFGPNSNKKGITDILDDIHTALEHRNLGGFTDNKAGSNFEVGWSPASNDNKAITVYTTIYTVIKTERP